MTATYQCSACKGVFVKGWSDAEARAEATEAFGKPPEAWKEEPMLVCDDCYKKMLPADHPDLVEKTKKKL